MMADLGRLVVILGAETSDFERAMAAAGATVKEVNNTMVGAGTASAGLWKQFAAGSIAADLIKKVFSELVSLFKDSVKGAMEEEASQNRLRIALDSTGRATETMLPSLMGMSKELSHATLYTHEEAEASFTLLTQLTKLDEQGMQGAVKGAMGLATLLKKDLYSATMLVVKAMDGNSTALKRAGIEIDKTKKGHELEAEIVAKLAPLYDQATGATETFAGKLKMLQKSTDEIKESLGKLIIDAITPLVSKVAEFAMIMEELIDTNKAYKQSSKDFEDNLRAQDEKLRQAAMAAGMTNVQYQNFRTSCREATQATKDSITPGEGYDRVLDHLKGTLGLNSDAFVTNVVALKKLLYATEDGAKIHENFNEIQGKVPAVIKKTVVAVEEESEAFKKAMGEIAAAVEKETLSTYESERRNIVRTTDMKIAAAAASKMTESETATYTAAAKGAMYVALVALDKKYNDKFLLDMQGLHTDILAFSKSESDMKIRDVTLAFLNEEKLRAKDQGGTTAFEKWQKTAREKLRLDINGIYDKQQDDQDAYDDKRLAADMAFMQKDADAEYDLASKLSEIEGLKRQATMTTLDYKKWALDEELRLEKLKINSDKATGPAEKARLIALAQGVHDAKLGLMVAENSAAKKAAEELTTINAGMWDAIKSAGISSLSSFLSGQSTLTEALGSLWNAASNAVITALVTAAVDAAISGEAIGAAMYAALGPIGLIIAALAIVVSVFTAFYESAGEKAANAFQNNLKKIQNEFQYLGEVSDKVAGEIARAMMKGATEAEAVAQNLGDMMRDTGIDVNNFAAYLSKATNTLTLYESGALSASEATALADDQFGQLVEAAKKLGTEGSAAMINFITTARADGLELKSINDYCTEMLLKVPAALETLIAGGAAAAASLTGLNNKLVEQEQALLGLKPGTDEYNTLLETIGKTKEEIAAQSAQIFKSKDDLIGYGVLAIVTFNNMLASGMSYTDALAAMSPSLNLLKDGYAALGIEAPADIAALLKITKVTEEHKGLFDAISANDQILQALTNSGSLMGEEGAKAFKVLTDNANNYYNQLLASGLTEDQAQAVMKKSLQDIYDASVANGIPLDANTQKLVDQAKAAGLVKDKVDMGAVAEATLSVLERLEKMFEKMFGFADDTKGVLEGINGQTYGYNMQENWSTNNPGDSGGCGASQGGGGCGASQGGTCFVEGVPVTMADGSKRPGEQVRVDDPVRAYDTETREFLTDYVDAVIVHEPEEVKQLVWINGIGVTPEHPFWINGAWRQVGDAQVGDHLVSDKGWIVDIVTKTWGPGGVRVWNLTLRNKTHDFFAGGVLVHNVAQKPQYAEGGIAWVPQVATLAENGPEAILGLDEYRDLKAGSGSRMSVDLGVDVKAVEIPFGRIVEKIILDFIPRATKNELLNIHPNAIRKF